MNRIKDSRTLPWFFIQNAIIDYYDITPLQFTVYAVLCRFASREGECWPSYAVIGRAAKCSRKAAMEAVFDLVDIGLIRKTIRRRSNGSQTSNLYEIVDPDANRTNEKEPIWKNDGGQNGLGESPGVTPPVTWSDSPQSPGVTPPVTWSDSQNKTQEEQDKDEKDTHCASGENATSHGEFFNSSEDGDVGFFSSNDEMRRSTKSLNPQRRRERMRASSGKPRSSKRFGAKKETSVQLDHASDYAEKLHDVLAKKNLLTRRKVNLTKWASTFRKFMTDENIDDDEFRSLLKWYCNHAGGKFVPAAYSAQGFCDRWIQIRVAAERDGWERPDPRMKMLKNGTKYSYVCDSCGSKATYKPKDAICTFIGCHGLDNKMRKVTDAEDGAVMDENDRPVNRDYKFRPGRAETRDEVVLRYVLAGIQSLRQMDARDRDFYGITSESIDSITVDNFMEWQKDHPDRLVYDEMDLETALRRWDDMYGKTEFEKDRQRVEELGLV